MLRTDKSEIVIGCIHTRDTDLVEYKPCLCASHTCLLDSYVQTLTVPFSLVLADVRKIHVLLKTGWPP